MIKKKSFIFLTSLTLALNFLGSCSAPIFVDKIIVDGKNKIDIGETTAFKADVYPTPKGEESVNWSVSDPSVAYVDKQGNVTGVSKGKTSISAKLGGSETKKDIFIGGYIEYPLESISISGYDALKVGDYTQLKVNVVPENATNKEVIWTSSDPKIVSVNENGVIKGEFAGEAAITATSKENNKQATFNINVSERELGEKLTIKSFSKPDCLVHYNEKIASLEEKIDEAKINRNNSKQYINNNFFKYEDSEIDKQIYKVGTDNPFRFKCNITTTVKDDPFKEISDKNPYQDFKLEEKTGDTYKDVTSSYKPSYKGNEIQFNKNDANKTFRLTVWPDKNKYEYTDDFSATLEFKVIDGYNAYDFAGLTTIDNWTLEKAKVVFKDKPKDLEFINKNQFIDLWGDYKKKHNIPLDVNATILHNNIALDLDALPDNIVWTEHEVSDYVNGVKFASSKDNFDSFVDIKTNIHKEWEDMPESAIRAKCANMLYKSLKDYTFIFQRTNRNGENDFKLEGNYFNIDCSTIKPVVLFEEELLPNYQKVRMLSTSIIGIGHHYPTRTYNKTTESGEYVYDLFRPYYGNRYSGEKPFTINNLNAFGSSVKDGTHDESLGVPCFINGSNITINNCIIHKFASIMQCIWTYDEHINKSKLFDTFSPIICANNAKLNIVDSIIKDGDGGCLRLTANISNKRDSQVQALNSYFESFISGNEVYNKAYIKTLFTKIIGNSGIECFEKYKNTKFGKDGKFAPVEPRNFIKIEDDVIYVNNIVTHEVDGNLASTQTDGTLNINNREVYDITKDYGEGGNLRQYIDSSLLVSCAMQGELIKSSEKIIKNKGHAKIPFLDIVSADDLTTYDNDGYSYKLSDYVTNKDSYDNDYPEIGEHFGNLFAGDFITFMFDLAGLQHFTFTLGYK